MRNTREALEAALVENPDDLVLHAAYSDLLIEEGDPRGEFIRLQLMHEDANLTPDQRLAAFLHGDEMLRKYRRVWLKPKLPGLEVLMSSMQTPRWARGWVHSVELSNTTSPLDWMESIPTCRLVRSITVVFNQPFNRMQNEGNFIVHSLSKLPLHSLSFSGLPIGDWLIDALCKRQLIDRLKSFCLIACNITDDGARLLARAPTISQLDVLNLSENYISPAGFADLRAAGANVFGEASQRFGRPIL